MAITDRARDTWDRISPRERRLVVIGGIALPLVLAIWLGLAIRDGLIAIETKNAKTRKALIVLADLKARGTASASSAAAIQFPKEALSLPTYLSEAATTAGFKLKGTTPRNPVNRDGFVTESVAINVDDLDLEQLKTFLEAVETKDTVAITHLSITRDRSDKSKVDAKLEVSTYAHPDEAAGSGSGSGGTSSGSSGTGR